MLSMPSQARLSSTRERFVWQAATFRDGRSTPPKLIGRVFQNPFSGTRRRMTIAENSALALKRAARGLGWGLGPNLRNERAARAANGAGAGRPPR